MKRKIIITILCLTMGLSIVACGKQETTATTEQTSEDNATIEGSEYKSFYETSISEMQR